MPEDFQTAASILRKTEEAAQVATSAIGVAKEVVASAAVVAKEVIANAAVVAKDLISKASEDSANESNVQSLSEALRKVFGEGETAGKFIDVRRIPLICQQIGNIHDSLKDMKDSLKQMANAKVVEELKNANKDKDKDTELRLRRLEFWGGMAAGGLFVLQIVFHLAK